MKNKIDLLLAIFLVVISFGFISCESDQEEIEAKYTYLSDFYYYGGLISLGTHLVLLKRMTIIF